MDDLGLPVEGDPRAFALAFATVPRQCNLRAAVGADQSLRAFIDDLGFPLEGDPARQACLGAEWANRTIRRIAKSLEITDTGWDRHGRCTLEPALADRHRVRCRTARARKLLRSGSPVTLFARQLPPILLLGVNCGGYCVLPFGK